MKAAVYTKYGPPGDVVQIADVEKPVPKDNEALIKVRAASINPLDWRFMRGKPVLGRLLFGLRKPKITHLGVDVAGQVEAVGRNVTQFKPGDEVFGVCRGAFAEYACAAEEKLDGSRPTYRWRTQQPYQSRHSLLFRVFAIKVGSRQATKLWLMAHLAAWVRFRSRLQSRWGRKSLRCAAQGMWKRRGRLAQTMLLITRGKISRRAGSVTI